jgi:hypothetical protein
LSNVPRLQTTQGVIKCYQQPPTTYQLGELQKELYQDYGVIRVDTVYQYINGVRTATNVVRLDFDLNDLPSHVMIGGTQRPVKVFDPPISQCGRCSRWGHQTFKCSFPWSCRNCGRGPNHSEDQCRAPTKCITCTGSHSARDRDNCPAYALLRIRQRIINRKRQTVRQLDLEVLQEFNNRRTILPTPPPQTFNYRPVGKDLYSQVHVNPRPPLPPPPPPGSNPHTNPVTHHLRNPNVSLGVTNHAHHRATPTSPTTRSPTGLAATSSL